MTYVIALPCVDVKDRACIDECPVDCIYEGERSRRLRSLRTGLPRRGHLLRRRPARRMV